MNKLLWLVVAAVAVVVTAGCTGLLKPGTPGEGLVTPAQPGTDMALPVSPETMIAVPVTHPANTTSMMTPAPSNDEGLTARISIERDIISTNETISFRIINQGFHMLVFRCGDPYHLEWQDGKAWIRITGAGGTQAFWNLNPGETSASFSWSTATPHWGALYKNVSSGERYTFTPGRYRVVVEAIIPVKAPAEDIPVTYTREFVIQEQA